MLVVGFLLTITFGVWERYFAKQPVFPLRFIRNHNIVASALIGSLDFVRKFRKPGQFILHHLTFCFLAGGVLLDECLSIFIHSDSQAMVSDRNFKY